MICAAHPSWKRYDNVRSSGKNPRRSTRSARGRGGVHVHSVEKSFRRPVKNSGRPDAFFVPMSRYIRVSEAQAWVVRQCHDQDPYARVAQPFGRAGNALRLHCPTLFGTLPPACINSTAAALALIRLAAPPAPSPATLWRIKMGFVVLYRTSPKSRLCSPISIGLHTVPVLCAINQGDILEWCR